MYNINNTIVHYAVTDPSSFKNKELDLWMSCLYIEALIQNVLCAVEMMWGHS